MKFRCERDVLLEALTTAGRAVSSRGGSLPVLSGLLFELTGDNLRVTGSDLDLTISVERVVNGESDGHAVIPAKLITDIVRSFKNGAIAVEVDADQAHVSAERSEFAVRVLPVEEYPRFERPSGEGVTIDADKLLRALRQVVPAAGTDDSRQILTGVLMTAERDGLRLVATDSYRLAVRDVTESAVLSEGQSILVPSRALTELTRVLGAGDEVRLVFGQRDASFRIADVSVSTRLIEGDFPNYKGLIPSSHPNKVIVERDAFLEALRRVRLMAQEATPVRVVMRESGIELVAITQDVGQAHEDLDADYDGQELTVAFNPQYLLDGVDVCSGEKLKLETVDALKPAVLRSVDDDSFLYLLMPVRVS